MTTNTTNTPMTDMHYLQLLSQSFPTIADASTEIINLEAILALPKGTEHFLADIHGESEAFRHVLKNASGNIKRKVNELFGNNVRESEKKELCTLIYYPEQKLEIIKARETDIEDWYRITIHQLVKVCRDVSSKYTRSKVRKSLPADFSYIIEELLHESLSDHAIVHQHIVGIQYQCLCCAVLHHHLWLLGASCICKACRQQRGSDCGISQRFRIDGEIDSLCAFIISLASHGNRSCVLTGIGVV